LRLWAFCRWLTCFFTRLGQFAAVGLAIGVDFLIDPRFAVFQFGRLAGDQLAGSHVLRDAILLVAAGGARYGTYTASWPR
jgi:hypothetical protein